MSWRTETTWRCCETTSTLALTEFSLKPKSCVQIKSGLASFFLFNSSLPACSPPLPRFVDTISNSHTHTRAHTHTHTHGQTHTHTDKHTRTNTHTHPHTHTPTPHVHRLCLKDGQLEFVRQTDVEMNVDTWYHTIVTVTTDSVQMLINGDLVASGAIPVCSLFKAACICATERIAHPAKAHCNYSLTHTHTRARAHTHALTHSHTHALTLTQTHTHTFSLALTRV